MLVVIEGIDGSGKSTVAKKLKEELEKRGYKVYLTSEPTNGPVGQIIRKILKKEIVIDEKFLPHVLTLLYTADRYYHQKEIREALEKYDYVILDRYYHSTIVYQHFLQDIPLSFILDMHKFVIRPDIVFVLDISPKTALKRLEKSREIKEYFEEKEKLEKLREGYLKLKDILKDEKIVYINAEKNLDDVIKEILQYLCS